LCVVGCGFLCFGVGFLFISFALYPLTGMHTHTQSHQLVAVRRVKMELEERLSIELRSGRRK
jgi:hypothetical protein